MSNEESVTHPEDQEIASSFGAGCFHFGLTSETFSPESYSESISAALAKVPNIKEIEVAVGDSFRFDGDVPRGAGSINTDFGVHPWPLSGHIRFDIMIPKRLHDKYTSGWREIDSEEISVWVQFNRYLPVAYVYSADRIEREPSTMVSLVRKYLEEAIGTDGPVTFNYVGPSPFHCDFYEHVGSKPGIAIEYIHHRGYDIGNIFRSRELGEDFLIHSFELMAEDLGFFYAAQQKTNILSERMRRLVQQIEELAPNDGKNVFHRIGAKLIPPSASDLIIETELCRIEIAQQSSLWNERKNSNTQRKSFALTESATEKQFAYLNGFPLDAYRKIADVADQKHKAISGNRAVVLSALISAIISLAIGIWLPTTARIDPGRAVVGSVSSEATSDQPQAGEQ